MKFTFEKLRIAMFLLTALFGLSQARAASDAEIIRGFNLTVFGAEYSNALGKPKYIRKFSKPVRFMVHDFSGKKRKATVERFIRSVNKNIRGLNASIINDAKRANFNVYIVTKKNHDKIAREKLSRKVARNVSGNCFAHVKHWRGGITSTVAIIISDNGEAFFKHCMVEEIVQGLGVINDNSTLHESIFNDRSKKTSFGKFDKIIMNMLYDKRIKNGASFNNIQQYLPVVLNDVRRRIR
ncbi:MAG: hypothetical protein COC17_06660 [Hyphomicrobiales bacterium]|nr:MAG: hypothetical protein COC17_06660 [Hyphomicrobiales bacterium]